MRKTRGRTAIVGSLLAAGLLCLGAIAAQAAELVVSNASGDPGTPVTFTVTLNAQGASVAGTQSDIAFDPANIPVAAKANGHPNCTVNPDISKGATSFAFRPNACTGAACTAVRALVLATDNTDPIPDGSVLFTCTVDIAATASGTFPLTQTGIILSDPNGVKVTPATSVDGSVTAGTAGPTPTPTTATVACPTARPAPAGPGLWIPDQSEPPAVTSITVKLAAGGAMIAGTQSDITFPIAGPIAAKANGHPDCAVNPDISKGATSFAFRPNGCTGTDCTAVRALVLATDNTDPIPDGSVLFTCNVAVGSSASGNLDYTFSGVILSDPNGTKVPDTGDQDGLICVPLGPPTSPTPTPVPVITPCPSARPSPAGPGLWIPDQSVAEGATTAVISVKLAAGGAMIAGTQSDITFPTNAPIAAKANGHPDCTVNADINKGATSFAFRPNACTGTACTAVRALVLATDNTDPIPDGSVLFTCNVTLDPTNTATLDYTFSGVILSDPNGTKVPDTGDQDGTICIAVNTPTPTLTPTPAGGATNTPTPGEQPTCPTARPAPAGPALWIPDQAAPPVPTSIQVKLAAGGKQIAGMQTDIAFPAADVIAAKANGHPDCTVNPDINKGATSFGFRPASCTGTACNAVRAIVLATDNTDPIPDGSVLFTCNIAITSTTGSVDYTMSGTVLSDPNGVKVPDAGDQGGIICITGETPPTATATPVNTPTQAPVTPPATATATFTATPRITITPGVVTSTLSRAILATDTTIPLVSCAGFPDSGTIRIESEQITYNGKDPAGATGACSLTNAQRGANGTTAAAHAAGAIVLLVPATPTPSTTTLEDEGGCQIGTAGHSSGGWLLLVPMVGLLVVRRRNR